MGMLAPLLLKGEIFGEAVDHVQVVSVDPHRHVSFRRVRWLYGLAMNVESECSSVSSAPFSCSSVAVHCSYHPVLEFICNHVMKIWI